MLPEVQNSHFTTRKLRQAQESLRACPSSQNQAEAAACEKNEILGFQKMEGIGPCRTEQPLVQWQEEADTGGREAPHVPRIKNWENSGESKKKLRLPQLPTGPVPVKPDGLILLE